MSFLEFCGVAFVAIAVLFGIVTLLAIQSLPKRVVTKVDGSHILITGGSKGIGKALALEFIQKGARVVSIVARNRKDLEAAKSYLYAKCKDGQAIHIFELDVTASYEKICDVVAQIEANIGAVDILVNNAGMVVQGAFDDLRPDDFERQMVLNFIGAVRLTRAVLPSMKVRNHGHVCFVSSAAGQCPIWGYSAYSPSKAAIKALADVLFLELIPYKISVSVLYPPNTDTEGFEVEKREMSEQTRQLSGSAGLFDTQTVAAACVSSIQKGNYSCSVGLEGWMLSTIAAGGGPESDPIQALIQSMLAGPLRAVMLIYHGSFQKIVTSLHKPRQH